MKLHTLESDWIYQSLMPLPRFLCYSLDKQQDRTSRVGPAHQKTVKLQTDTALSILAVVSLPLSRKYRCFDSKNNHIQTILLWAQIFMTSPELTDTNRK